MSGCTDSEIKELNGKWEGCDGDIHAIITIKNGNGEITESEKSTNDIGNESQPYKFKITKEGEQLFAIDEEGDKVSLQLVGEKLKPHKAIYANI